MVLWVGVKGIPYGFMGGCKRYILFFMVGVRDIPYGFMCGCMYILFLWVGDKMGGGKIYLMVLWVGVRGIFYFLWWV